MKVFMLAAALVGSVWARCPNDCNGKGICNAASVCECYSNYMGNDCSQRVCTFGKAWIDTNLGDLNANGILDTDQQVYMGYANTLVAEQYDPNYGIARPLNTAQWDEAHFYRECSNKGTCNRKTGLCACFPGFEGEGCRRMSCPLDCNGHGKCQMIEDELTKDEYTLWDQDKVQGCHCDPGYSGPDCSRRECPMGADPVEYTYSNIDTVYKLEFKSVAGLKWNLGTTPNGPTYFTITYTDDFGDAWTTHAVTMYYQADCDSTGNWDPETKATDTCTSTPFVANPTIGATFGDVRNATFLGQFYETNFLFDGGFVGEQVNNTLKHLPNDKIRAPYVWTVYNPVNVLLAPNELADKGFLYPSKSVLNFDTAFGITGNSQGLDPAGNDAAAWFQCTSSGGTGTEGPSDFCSKYGFANGPSAATDDPKYRFPVFFTTAAMRILKASQKVADAAALYLSCPVFSTCIFIRIPGAEGNRQLSVNYHYKPASYLLKTDQAQPGVQGTALTANYDIMYGAEQRGNDKTAGGIVTVSSVGAQREWIRELDGDPTIAYETVTAANVHSCSRRGLCDFDTGKCNCFFGYTGNNCHVRTPSSLQGL